MKNITVLGKGSLSISVCQNILESKKYNLVNVVPVLPEPTWTPSLLDWCLAHDVSIIKSGDYNDLPPDSFDLGVSVFYDKILSADYINKCKRLINIHNAPLPKYRGMNPINWALKNNETEHGVTIHEIEPGIDSGKIISQVKYSIFPDSDEVIDVYNRSLSYAKTLFEETINIIDDIIPAKQNENEATYYSQQDYALLEERKNFTRQESLC